MCLAHPLAAFAHAVPASATARASALSHAVLHKATDPHALALLMEEARLAMQFGRPQQALAILQFIDHAKAPLPHVHYLIAV